MDVDIAVWFVIQLGAKQSSEQKQVSFEGAFWATTFLIGDPYGS